MNIQRICGALVISIFLLAGPLTGQAGADPIPADFDDDGDIDLADFAEFQTCFLGPAIPQTDPECPDARLDADPDVDLGDFELFHGCLSGAGNPADPNCACPSGQTNCDGTCVSTASDQANCGACGNACAAELACLSGSCAPCPVGQAECGGVCMGFQWNNANCGSCGNACPYDTSCVAGFCEPQEPCPGCRVGAVMVPGDFDQDGDIDLADFADFQTCVLGPDISQSDPECADARLDTDPDVDLDDFEVFQGCLSGADNPADPNCACPSGQTNCDGTCTNTASDYLNCGACGNYCAAGVCQNGSCALCPPPALYCGGCVDPYNDSQNCGSCFHACAGNEYCSGGTCVPSEPCPDCRVSTVMIPGDFDDDGDIDLADFADFQTCFLGPATPQTDPDCADARLDSDEDVDLDDFVLFQGCLSGPNSPPDPNCACPSGWSNCDGTCVSTASDNANCGACDNVCAAGLVCQSGSCAACPVDTILCGAFCVYWDSDIGNCGSCGHSCGGGEQCYGGDCHPADPCGPECGGGGG